MLLIPRSVSVDDSGLYMSNCSLCVRTEGSLQQLKLNMIQLNSSLFHPKQRKQLMKRKTLSENNLGMFGNKYGRCASKVMGYEVRSKGWPGTQSFLAL